MVRRRFFDHTSPGGSTMIARIRATSYLREVARGHGGREPRLGHRPAGHPARSSAPGCARPTTAPTCWTAAFAEIGIGVAAGAPIAAGRPRGRGHLRDRLRAPAAGLSARGRAARVAGRHGRRPAPPRPALRPGRVGSLADVVAPPYDVIDPEQRAALAARSPYNVVRIDLPEGGARPLRRRGRRSLERWRDEGAVVRDDEPALWALTQDYTGPDGRRSLTRHGFFARVRVEDYGPGRIRPHERTHPGPKEDRLRLTRATKANLSPIFSLYDDPTGAARRRARARAERRGAR